MVIKETIRLYPSLPVFGRKLQRDFDVGEWNVILFHHPTVFNNSRKNVPCYSTFITIYMSAYTIVKL
jgi:hypothetical protein